MGPTSRNLIQAFAVCFGAFVFPAFLVLSFLNQQLRKVGPRVPNLNPNPNPQPLTPSPNLNP